MAILVVVAGNPIPAWLRRMIESDGHRLVEVDTVEDAVARLERSDDETPPDGFHCP
jgi:hypothetical protein